MIAILALQGPLQKTKAKTEKVFASQRCVSRILPLLQERLISSPGLTQPNVSADYYIKKYLLDLQLYNTTD